MEVGSARTTSPGSPTRWPTSSCDVNPEVRRLALERGDRIRIAREAAGVTLDEVAKDIAVSRATLWKWETGQVVIYSAVPMLWLARRLYTTQEWILFGTGDPRATAPRWVQPPEKRGQPRKDEKP